MSYAQVQHGAHIGRGSFRARFFAALAALLTGQAAVALLVAWYENPGDPFHHLPTTLMMLGVSFPVLAVVCGLWAWVGRRCVSHEEASRLLLSKGLYRALVERSTNVFAMCLPDGQFVYGSPSAEAVVQVNPQDLTGRNVFDYAHPDDARTVRDALGYLSTHPNETRHVEFRWHLPNGEWTLLEAAAYAIVDSDSGTTGIVASLRDISKQRRREEDLVRSGEELERRVAERTRELATVNEALHKEIDDRQRIAHALLVSEARLRQAQEMVNLAYWELDLDTGEVVWSDEMYRLLGLEPGSTVPSYDLFRAHVPQEEREQVDRTASRSLRELAPSTVDHRIVREDGQERHIHTEASVVRGDSGTPTRFIGTSQDVTELRVAERALARSNTLLSALASAQSRYIVNHQFGQAAFSLLQDLLSLTDSPDGYLAEVVRDKGNGPYLQVHACILSSIASESGQPSSTVRIAVAGLDPELQQAIDTSDACVMTARGLATAALGPFPDSLSVGSLLVLPLEGAPPVNGVLVMANRPDGYEKDMVTSLQPLATTCGVLIEAHRNNLLREEVERMLAEEHESLERMVDERTHELRTSLAQLAETNRQKTRFLSSLSHELRTPLNAVLGFADLLEGQHYGQLNAKQLEYVGLIEDGGNRLNALVGDLLDIIKIDTGRMELESVPLQASECLRNVSLAFQPQANERGLDLSAHVDDGLPPLRADPNRCRQILTNLLSNAIKFTPAGGRVEMRARAISSGFVRVEVSDTGPGIEPEALPGIFSEFYQAERVYDEQLGGTGIGLALTRRLVELQGGEIGVENHAPEGATFWFTLPCEHV